MIDTIGKAVFVEHEAEQTGLGCVFKKRDFWQFEYQLLADDRVLGKKAV